MGRMAEDDKGGRGVILGQILADVICERSLMGASVKHCSSQNQTGL